MPVTVSLFKSFKDYLGDGGIGLGAATILAVPVLNLAFDQNDQDLADIGGEVTTNGAGRLTLASQIWGLAGNDGLFDCEDLEQVASGGPLVIDGYVLADDTGSPGADSGRELICHIQNDADLTAPDGYNADFLTPSGLFTIG